MVRPVLTCVPYAVAASIALFGVCAQAQEPAASEAPAHISVVDGAVTLERDGQPDASPASMPLMAGDRLRTDRGRVEVMFGDGATLHLDVNSTVDFQSDALIRLLEGRVRITVPGPRRAIAYRIDAPAGSVEIREPGDYRVAVTRSGREPEVELAVLRGAADLLNEDGQTSLRAGERALVRTGLAPSTAYAFNSAAFDEFDRWSDGRRNTRAGVSAQYLPETVRPYSSTFDQYGDWRYDSSYGYVWYPTVAVGWRPYFYGRWASFPTYGWTWIGTDAWAWPTHHYGRWGFSGSSWYWIPGRTWGAAWVSWAYAPGYVSWCPLGWDNRAVLHFGHAGTYGGRYDAWSAWTVVPHQRFGVGYVNVSYQSHARLDVRTRDAFVVRANAPELRGYAVPRNSAPIRAAGSRGVSVQRADVAGGRVASGSVNDVRPSAAAGSIRGLSRPGPQDDAAAAAFRNRGPESTSRGVGYPAAARQPRDAAEVGGRIIGSRTAQERPRDLPGVTVYRGAVPRQSDQVTDPRATPGANQRTSGAPAGRTDVAGSASAGTQPAGGAAVRRADPARTGEIRRYEPPGYQPAPSANAPGAGYAPVPRTPAQQAPARQAPSRQMSYQPPNAGQGAVRQSPGDRTPGQNEAYRAMPRQAPDAPPAYRSNGGMERRSAPSGPPPSAAPPREQARPAGAQPRNDAPRGRPSGDDRPTRGAAVRRGGA